MRTTPVTKGGFGHNRNRLVTVLPFAKWTIGLQTPP